MEIDPRYLDTVTINEDNPVKVFIQLEGDCMGTYVVPGKTGFDVMELQGGKSGARFTYRVVAKKRGFESRRLEICEVARTDPSRYSGLSEEQRRKIEESNALSHIERPRDLR